MWRTGQGPGADVHLPRTRQEGKGGRGSKGVAGEHQRPGRAGQACKGHEWRLRRRWRLCCSNWAWVERSCRTTRRLKFGGHWCLSSCHFCSCHGCSGVGEGGGGAWSQDACTCQGKRRACVQAQQGGGCLRGEALLRGLPLLLLLLLRLALV